MVFFCIVFIFSVQATLEKFVRNGALVKKELSSYRSQIFKDGVEAVRISGNLICFLLMMLLLLLFVIAVCLLSNLFMYFTYSYWIWTCILIGRNGAYYPLCFTSLFKSLTWWNCIVLPNKHSFFLLTELNVDCIVLKFD